MLYCSGLTALPSWKRRPEALHATYWTFIELFMNMEFRLGTEINQASEPSSTAWPRSGTGRRVKGRSNEFYAGVSTEGGSQSRRVCAGR